MNNPNNIRFFPPNPETRRLHRRQSWWQILFPVLLGVMIILVLAILTAVASTSQVVRFSDISIAFLIIPTALIGLILLMVLSVGIFGLSRIIDLIPHYAAWTQNFIDRITLTIKDLADKAAQPVVNVDSAWAGLKVLFNRESDGTH